MSQKGTSIKFGIVTGIFLIVYFILLGLLGYNNSPLLSIVNILICAAGIFLALSEHSEGKEYNYKQGFRTGFLTGLYATIVFTIFFGLYSGYNPEFAKKLYGSLPYEFNLTLLIIGTLVLGVISVLVITFIIMQLMKKSWRTKSEARS